MGKLHKTNTCNGQDLRAMFAAATALLERNAAAVNALNVFPVPDGDTGTNMLLTMRATMEEASQAPSPGAGAIAQAMARGALMGARGNSGVILSQILHGLAKGLQGKESFKGPGLAAALHEASAAAYRGVAAPVEGTILTVIREASEAAQAAARANGRSVVGVMEATVEAARASVIKTQHLLPVLQESGVVDAGGQGLYVMLTGALLYLQGTPMDESEEPTAILSKPPAAAPSTTRSGAYGHCTEFLLQGQNLNLEKIRNGLMALGESLLVVGDEQVARVHIHTLSPNTVIDYASALGTVVQVKTENMDDQHRDFLSQANTAAAEIAVVAVASGDGLKNVFRSLGAAEIVPGGETMNPSVQDLLNATRMVAADKVILLPNNSNIVPAARQASALAKKRVEVVPTESIPQGVAAIVAFNSQTGMKANLSAMEDARRSVRSGKITTAVRATHMGNVTVKKGQFVGMVEDAMVVASDSIAEALRGTLQRMDVGKGSLITLYYGSGASSEEAQRLAAGLRNECCDVELEVVRGGQPHYSYIVSVE